MNPTKRQTKEQEKAHEIEFLRKQLKIKRGTRLFTCLKSVSSSGMSRQISVFHAVKHGEVVNISWSVAKILDWKLNKDRNAVIVGGCGMDMGFHLINSLSRSFFGNKAKNDTGYYLNQSWI